MRWARTRGPPASSGSGRASATASRSPRRSSPPARQASSRCRGDPGRTRRPAAGRAGDRPGPRCRACPGSAATARRWLQHGGLRWLPAGHHLVRARAVDVGGAVGKGEGDRRGVDGWGDRARPGRLRAARRATLERVLVVGGDRCPDGRARRPVERRRAVSAMGGGGWNGRGHRRRRRGLRPDPPAALRTGGHVAGRSGRAGARRARAALCPGPHRGRLGRLVLGMTTRRAGVAALVLGLVAAALLHARVGAPPLSDAITVPPEPYRWESPPPDLRAGNKPPLSGEATLPVLNGQVAGGGVQTGDSQVVIYFGPGAFKAPAGATSVKCTIAPDPNPPAPPAGVEIRGNIYRVTCVGQPGGQPVTVVSSYHLTMRFPPGAFKEIQYYDGGSWRALPTLRSPGGDPYASVNAPGFGEYAASAPTGAPGPSIFSDLGRYAEFYGILAFVIIFGAIAIIQEVRRRRQRAPASPKKNPRWGAPGVVGRGCCRCAPAGARRPATLCRYRDAARALPLGI